METRAVEESFSWTPRSRKTFVREVPLLSKGGAEAGCPVPEKQKKREGGGGGGREGRQGVGLGRIFWRSPPTNSPNPLEEAKLRRRTLGLVCGFTGLEGWGSVGRGLRGGE